jgi:hypothetical protein
MFNETKIVWKKFRIIWGILKLGNYFNDRYEFISDYLFDINSCTDGKCREKCCFSRELHLNRKFDFKYDTKSYACHIICP